MTTKDITNIQGPVRLIDVNGNTSTFNSGTEAMEAMGSGYNYTPLSNVTRAESDGYHSMQQLPEVEVVAQVPKEQLSVDRPEIHDPIRDGIFEGRYGTTKFNPTDENISRYLKIYDADRKVGKGYGSRAWGKLGLINLGGAAAAGAGAFIWPWVSSYATGALNLTGAYEGSKQVVEHAPKLWKAMKEGNLLHVFGEGIDTALGGLLATPGVSKMLKVSNDASKSFSNGFVKGMLRKKNSPTFNKELGKFDIDLLLSNSTEHLAENASTTLQLPVPTSGKINYGSIVVLPRNGEKTIALDSPDANLAFIKKFNKWNRRYGYPMLPKSLANDGNALNKAIQDRLKEHNTFVRGVFIDKESNPEKYQQLIDQMIKQGIEPTPDNTLEFLATHYLPETNKGGRSGFFNIPLVKNSASPNIKNDIGTIYTSNSLDQAVGYANRAGKSKYRGVFKVQRPLSFEGSREDWVLNSDFPLYARGKDKSNTYYQYELPYLMSVGKAVPKLATIDENEYNQFLRNVVPHDGNYDRISDIYKTHGRVPKIYGFGKGTPFLNFRAKGLFNKLFSMRDKIAEEKFYRDYFPKDPFLPFDNYLPPDQYQKALDQASFPQEVLDKFESIVNSKRYRNAQYNKYKEFMDVVRRHALRSSMRFPTTEEIKQFVIQSGITPNKPVLNIGTSEALRTSTINTPEKAFQHVIFAGTPWQKGLELVERIPYSQWKDIIGTTAHIGNWTPGLSRKSKKQGGKLEKEV